MTKVQKITRLNPTSVANPVGNYSHITIIPQGASLYTFSGQIGADTNGIIPQSFNMQVKNIFENISKLLESQELSFEDIIKVNIWAIQEIDWDYFDAMWSKCFLKQNPSMTVAYITALGLPEISLEIEIWAAK